MNGIKKWKKVLYEDQGVPTNYTDESFLEDMKKNGKLVYILYIHYQVGMEGLFIYDVCISKYTKLAKGLYIYMFFY